MILKKYFYFAFLMLASIWMMPSCSDHDDVTGGEGEKEEHVSNPAGDDFYMFVNGEWYESLEDKNTDHGFQKDNTIILQEKTSELIASLDGVADKLEQSIAHLNNNGGEANLSRLQDIFNELCAGVETKADAYRAIGKMIGMGLADDKAKLFILPQDEKIHYTIAPPTIEAEEEGSQINGRYFTNIWKKFQKYTPYSRTSSDEVIMCLIEGLGFDKEYFVASEELLEFINTLEKSSLEELLKFIKTSVAMQLMPYCGDEYALELTQGVIKTSKGFLDTEFAGLFRYPLSYHFYNRYVSEETREDFKGYIEELRDAFAKRIENSSWLSAQSKQAALNKLENTIAYVGWPEDEYTEEAFPKLQGKLLVDDIIEAKMSRTRLFATKVGKNLRDESMIVLMFSPGGMALTEYNAVNVEVCNTVNIFPAFMMEPEYSPEMTKPQLYALLAVIAHELGHSYDCTAVDYDAMGNPVPWLTAAEKAEFNEMIAQFIAQISTFEVAPGIKQDGNLTVNENLADVIGLCVAFDAMNEYLKQQGVTGDELVEAQKAFFERHAHRYFTTYSPEEFETSLKDVHGFDMVRVNGIVQHMDSWYELYNVVEGDALYLPKEKRIIIW